MTSDFTHPAPQSGLSATALLAKAAETLNQRGVDYDNPKAGERSIPGVVRLFNTATGASVTEAEGWLFMLFLKVVRSQQSPDKVDNFVDLIGYAALYGESALSGGAVRTEKLPN